MSSDEEQEIEAMVQKSNPTPFRVTPKDLDDAIDPKVPPQFHVFPGSTVTVCCLRLKNGFHLVGESAAVDERNFDAAIGREVAYKEARNKLWPLLGFAKREALCEHMSGEIPAAE